MGYRNSMIGLLSAFILAFAIGPSAAYGAGDWDQVLKAARQEGTAILGTNLGLPKFRQAMTDAFKKRFGFDLEIRSMRGSELTAIAGRECAAGRVSMDVLLSGNSEITSLYPRGCLAPLKDKLLLPEVVDPKKWRGGFLKFSDPDDTYMLQMAEYLSPLGAYNTNLVKGNELKSVQGLLDPKFKGKIASFDPRQGGAGQGAASYLLYTFGDEFIQRLYIGQEVVYTTNHRQLAGWVARGVHAIGLAATPRAFMPLVNEGLPLRQLEFDDFKDKISGGSSVMKTLKNAPHPNAAIVLANFIASKEGQEIFENNVLQKSRRLDVRVPAIPDFAIPQANVNYHDEYKFEYYTVERIRARKRLIKLLGR